METRRVHRSWSERLLLWPRAYETKVSAFGHELIGRGPTPKASQEVATKRWNEKNARDEQDDAA